MNGYVEAPTQTSLLKISKMVANLIGPDLTLLPHSLVAPTHPPWSQFRAEVLEAARLLNEQGSTAQIPQSKPLSPIEVVSAHPYMDYAVFPRRQVQKEVGMMRRKRR